MGLTSVLSGVRKHLRDVRITWMGWMLRCRVVW
jgi:hypothetical protein